MKKFFFYIALPAVVIMGCKKDDDDDYHVPQPPEEISTQNEYDDKAIQRFLAENYFDERGNIKALSATNDSDNSKTPLAAMNPVKLPSGVVVIVRYNPENGVAIGDTDAIKIMQNTTCYLATDDTDGVKFYLPTTFVNSIGGSGMPQDDPIYYYVKDSVLKMDAYKDKTRDYFEIEGLREGMKYFKSCQIPDVDNYNLQGVIIVPSRAAFARDESYPYLGSTSAQKNQSFVFNFQIYNTKPRTEADN